MAEFELKKHHQLIIQLVTIFINQLFCHASTQLRRNALMMVRILLATLKDVVPPGLMGGTTVPVRPAKV